MSDTHVAMAKFRQEGVHEWQGEEGSTDATNLAAILDAQVEATLALAYEQRTANLIALWNMDEPSALGLNNAGAMRDWDGVAKRVVERLGLA